MYIILSQSETDENVAEKIIHQFYEFNNLLIGLLQNKREEQYPGSALGLIKDLQNILKENKKTIDVISLEKTSQKLPAIRQIQEKFEFIHVYNYFRQIQGVGNECKLEINNSGKIKNINYAEIISTLNGTANSNINYNQKPQNSNSEYNRNQINEFEKLLNWKKARIYMNEYDTLKIRDTNFNIDSYVFSSEETLADFEYKFYQLKKKYLYITNDPFEQYCNSIDYNLHIIEQFKNISAFVYETLYTKNYLFDSKEKHMNEILELFFKPSQNEPVNLEELHNLEMEIKKYKNINDSGSNNKIKKKIKSKINKFIYKQRYEKQQNNNMTTLRLSSIMKQQEMQRFSSKVSGRNLSTHVDNVNPEKKVVNVTYNTYNNNTTTPNPNHINQSNITAQNNGAAPIIGVGTNGLPVNGKIVVGDTNIQNQNEANKINNNNGNFNLVNNQSGIINQNNNQINLVGQQNENGTFDKNIVQQPQNQNIKNINPLNTATAPINNMINIQGNNVPNVVNNNMINLNSPNNIQKGPMALNNLLSNLKSPTNANQSSQMLLVNSPSLNIQDRNSGLNINTLPNISPNITSNPNLQNMGNNHPINFNNINNPNLPHIPQNIQGIPQNNPNIMQNLPQNNNNLGVMGYLNPIQNPLMNIPNINQIIPGGQNYQNTPGQINNMGVNPINNALNNNNINNNQFNNQFNPSLIPQMAQTQQAQQPKINKKESGNASASHGNSNAPQNKALINQILGILQQNNNSSSSGRDPRKNKKK